MTVTHSSIIKFSTVTISLFSILSLTDSAYGAIINGNFNNGLNNWNTSGDVSIFSDQALLTTASAIFEDDLPTSGTPFNFSGNEVTDLASLEAFLGVEPLALEPTDTLLGAFEGSAIQQTFTALAGDELKFSGNFLTNEDSSQVLVNNDTAFLTLVNTEDNSSEVINLADLNSSLSTSPSSLGFLNETGVNNFSTTLTPGEYIFGLTVLDDSDSLVSSALLLDNIQIVNNPEQKTVPEPSTILGLFSMILLGNGLGFRLLINSLNQLCSKMRDFQ